MRAIGSDLHMDYSAMGQTTHLAARMEQMAMPGIDPDHAERPCGWSRAMCRSTPLGPVPVKGLTEPVEVYELVGGGARAVAAAGGCARGGSPASSGRES